MSRLLTWVNVLAALVVFFVLSQVASESQIFNTNGARLAAFIMCVILVGNAIHLAFGSEGWSRR